MTPSRAHQVLDLVLAGLNDRRAGVEILDSWVESSNVLCIVFNSRWVGKRYSPTGLRRVVESNWTVNQIAEYVLTSELGEPLGSLVEDLVLYDGVWWFHGDKPDWREPFY